MSISLRSLIRRLLYSRRCKIPPFLSFSLVVAFDPDLWLEVGHAVLRSEDSRLRRPEPGRGRGVRGRRGRRRRGRLRRRDYDDEGRIGRKAAKVNECRYMHGS